jgi:hypothetical protein
LGLVVERVWLPGRLYLDHKNIADFRRMHRDAVTAAGAELIRFARGCGLTRGEWIAIDGTKFRAVAGIDSTRERLALQRYLDSIDKADEEQQQASIDPSAGQTALEKLTQHPEPEVGFMLERQMTLPLSKSGAPGMCITASQKARASHGILGAMAERRPAHPKH